VPVVAAGRSSRGTGRRWTWTDFRLRSDWEASTIQRAADGGEVSIPSEELGVLVAVRWCGVEVARFGVVFGSSTPEPTAAPTCAVGSVGGIEQCRRGLCGSESPTNLKARRVQGGSLRQLGLTSGTRNGSQGVGRVNSLGQGETRCEAPERRFHTHKRHNKRHKRLDTDFEEHPTI